MKVRFTIAFFIACFCVVSCNKTPKEHFEGPMAECENGTFVGTVDNGVMAFKGIPYAKAPVGKLRWKAPEKDTPSKELKKANKYGKSGIQYYWHSEPITTKTGEDCLTLNVWTSSLDTKGKAVMVWLHGGAYGWGGTSEPIYDGRYFAAAHPDVVLVTCNYRIGIMGFVNFKNVPGCENYPDSENLGVLDCMMALQWVNENIGAFGGDNENVTVFGESAGGGLVSALLATDAAGKLFHRAIIESGAANLTLSKERSDERTDAVSALMALTGASSMDDLVALSESDIIEANEAPLDGDGNCVNDILSMPVRGTGLIAEDIYEAVRIGKAKDVDILVGTNLDELAYWINEMGDVPMYEMGEDYADNIYIYEHYYLRPMLEYYCEKFNDTEKALVDTYLQNHNEELGELGSITRFMSDACYRAPSIAMAEKHAGAGTGRTYMYLYERKNDSFAILGACHSAELPFVFMNPDETKTYGTYDSDFASMLSGVWVNFAKTGDPGLGWSEYDLSARKTMIFTEDSKAELVSDPYADDRLATEFTVGYGFVQTEG